MSIILRNDTSELDAQTLKNYQAIQSYYLAKENNFKVFWNEQIKKSQQDQDKELIELFNQEIGNVWFDIYNEVISLFQITNNVVTGYKIPNKQFSCQLAEDLYKKYRGIFLSKRRTKSEKGLNLKSQLGADYEKFIQSQLSNMAQNGTAQVIMTAEDNIRSSGKGIRAEAKEIISDIAIGKNIKNNSLLNEQIEVKYQVETIEKNNNQLSKELINQLYQDATNVYGIAAKNWLSKSGEQSTFTAATKVAAELNTKFANSLTGDNQGQPKTWNKDYAQSTANLHVSARLIDLLGPANILVGLGKDFTWVSDFIANRFFYMNIYYKKQVQNNEILDITASKQGTLHIRKNKITQNFLNSNDSSILHGLILPQESKLLIEQEVQY